MRWQDQPFIVRLAWPSRKSSASLQLTEPRGHADSQGTSTVWEYMTLYLLPVQ